MFRQAEAQGREQTVRGGPARWPPARGGANALREAEAEARAYRQADAQKRETEAAEAGRRARSDRDGADGRRRGRGWRLRGQLGALSQPCTARTTYLQECTPAWRQRAGTRMHRQMRRLSITV